MMLVFDNCARFIKGALILSKEILLVCELLTPVLKEFEFKNIRKMLRLRTSGWGSLIIGQEKQSLNDKNIRHKIFNCYLSTNQWSSEKVLLHNKR
jgi:hypothetical protein